MNKNKLCIFGIILMLLSTTAVMAIKEIDFDKRCDIIQPATLYRPMTVFKDIGFYGRFVDWHFDDDLNRTVYRSVLRCFAPSGHSRSHKDSSSDSVVEEVVVPEPAEPCVPTEVCNSHLVFENARYECTSWNKWHHCIDHDWVCDCGYDLFCDDYDGFGHSRHCVDWDCTKVVNECHMTGCEA